MSGLELSETIMEINNLGMGKATPRAAAKWQRRPASDSSGETPPPQCRGWNYLKLSWKSTTYEWDGHTVRAAAKWQRRPASDSCGETPLPQCRGWNYLKLSWKSTT
jgi:hypothetical protein